MRICTQFKSCTLTTSWLRDNLYRDTAPVPATNFVTGDNPDSYRDAAPTKLCTAIAPALNKICTMTAKTTPYPPCTVTLRSAQGFWLKYQVPIAIGTARCLSRVTQPPHIAGPLGVRVCVNLAASLC
jgi:hypothetical protein